MFDGLVAVADGGAEQGRVALAEVGPGDKEVTLALLAARQRAGADEHLDVVVEFLVDRGPIRQPLGDGATRVNEADRDGKLRAVAAGLQAEVFEPKPVRCAQRDGIVGVADAIAVHATVEIHAGDAVAVRLEDTLDHGWVIDVGGAFVMDDQVVALGVIGVAVDRQGWVRAAIRNIDDVHHRVGPRLDALLQDVFLLRVIVATAAGDQQDLERFGFVSSRRRARNEDERQRGSEHRGGSYKHSTNKCLGFERVMVAHPARECQSAGLEKSCWWSLRSSRSWRCCGF